MGATRSIIIVAIAALCALVAALLVGKLMSHPAKPAPVVVAAKPMAQVLVAQHDLAVGTNLSAGDLTWQPWPADSLNPSFITNGQPAQAAPAPGAAAVANNVTRAAASVVTNSAMDTLYGAIVREPILANEPVINSKLVRGGEGGFMAVVLHKNMQAIGVPITSATAAGGFILPGDRVDVLQSHQQEGGASPGNFGPRNSQVAQVLMRNVRVLAIDQATKAPKSSPSIIGAVATIEVPASDVNVIVKAKAQGEIILALRAYSDLSGPVGKAHDDDTTAAKIVRIFRGEGNNGAPQEMTVSP